jgi:cytochrome bd ubiquinol oxidase subunit II
MHTLDPTFLQGLWFVLIGVLWAGYFVLEGFDFGVGVLVRALGRDDVEKRMMIHTIGPVWDGNEVWLLTAGGATFAAFPGWYATTFSGFYIALFLVLAALIVRGVSFEFWGKVPSRRWRATWEWALAVSSGLAALLFGVAWANFVHGVPMNAAHQMTATLWDLLHPYALLGGLTTLTVFVTHGACFLSLRTTGDVQQRADTAARRLAPLAALLMIAFLIWTAADQSFDVGVALPAIAAGAAIAAVPLLARTSAARAFGASAGAILLLTVVLFAALYPNALPSTTSHAFDLTLREASSTHYTLTVMTVVAVIFVPIVLAYQAWTYWVFRHRLGREDFEGDRPTPISVLEQRAAMRPPRDRGTGGPRSATRRESTSDPSAPA